MEDSKTAQATASEYRGGGERMSPPSSFAYSSFKFWQSHVNDKENIIVTDTSVIHTNTALNNNCRSDHLIELTVRRLSAINDQGAIANLTSHSENLIPRIASSSSNPAIRTFTATQTSTNTVLYIQSLTVRPGQTCGAGKTSGPNPNQWLDVGTTTVANVQATIRTPSTPPISLDLSLTSKKRIWYPVSPPIVDIFSHDHLRAHGSQAKAEDSILLDPSMTCLSSIWSSIRRGNFLMPLADMCALLTEVLTVALANIPFSNATTYQGFKICVYISISILAFMLLTIIFALFRGHSFLKPPLNPETILQRLVYLSESQITYKLGDMGSWNEKDRNKIILFLNNTYSFKTVIGQDVSYKERIDIDEPSYLIEK
ncbi:hypothetical protein BP5796_02184 [Coleophoma crateriformis]|uniref:Uncharacterized protein n=1 Tax=Coleophoma crateriformis TaxID=565419 RepID=A0A3D8SXN2_9HELO|nr:hypothetical protein BP5796_02184 [Coleophoma crateriformis]